MTRALPGRLRGSLEIICRSSLRSMPRSQKLDLLFTTSSTVMRQCTLQDIVQTCDLKGMQGSASNHMSGTQSTKHASMGLKKNMWT